jgi:hypothetical protein
MSSHTYHDYPQYNGITDITARPSGLPELATSVRASQDDDDDDDGDDDDDDNDDDDDDDDFDIFLKPRRNPNDCMVN